MRPYSKAFAERNARLFNAARIKPFRRQVLDPLLDKIQAAARSGDVERAQLALQCLSRAEQELDSPDMGALPRAAAFVTGIREALGIVGQGSFHRAMCINGMASAPEPSVSETTTAAATAERPAVQYHRSKYVDEGSRIWKASIHESGHCVAGLLTRGVTVEGAFAKPDGSGRTDFVTSAIDRYDDLFLSVSGHASCYLFLLPTSGLEGDAADMAKHGVSVEMLGPYEMESDSLKQARTYACERLQPHQDFIRQLAVEIYRRGPDPVSGSEIVRLWNEYIDGR